MISNLPLLFADGQPTCLENINVGQLEKFVPFMVQCSCGQNDVRKLTAPPWWPASLQFSIPLVKPDVTDSKWLLILKNLVYRCYHYHECDFMLRFCTDLSHLSSAELKYVNSWDGTTSLYNKVTGKLLVTFRNENLFYDKKRSSPKKTLLSRNNGDPGEQQAMVQPPLYDVYLCDNCDEEFSTLKEVQEHEKSCCRKLRDPSPPQVTEKGTKESFLNYFNLISTTESNIVRNVDHPRRKRGFRNSFWYSSIPISSPLGKLVYKKTRASAATSLVQLERLERYCPAKPSSVDETRVRGSTPWPVSWKPRKKADEDDWVHVYRKPGRQWRGRTRTSVQNKLCEKKQSLLSRCQDLHVHVKKLTPREIALYTTNYSSARKASVGPVIEESKCIGSLVSRQSTNSVHLPSQRVPSSVIENRNSKKQRTEVLTSLNEQCTSNGKRVNNNLYNNTAMNRKQKSEIEANVSPKITNSFSLASALPHIGYKTLNPEQSCPKTVSSELSFIPVIDLVSSDEECEII